MRLPPTTVRRDLHPPAALPMLYTCPVQHCCSLCRAAEYLTAVWICPSTEAPALYMPNATLLYSVLCCRAFDNEMNLAIHAKACLIYTWYNITIFPVLMQSI